MQTHTFIAETAVQAVDEIREKLGPTAVILNVRKLPAEGLARIWRKPRIEVLAAAPAPVEPPRRQLRPDPAIFPVDPPPALAPQPALVEEPASLPEPSVIAEPFACVQSNQYTFEPTFESSSARGTSIRSLRLLEQSGLTPVVARRVLDEALRAIGHMPPQSLAEELRELRHALVRLWPARPESRSNTHVFIGPPGAGKTTVLSKLLARAVLVEGRHSRVWRWDSHVANTAECLSVMAEVLGVPVDRCNPASEAPAASDLVLVDLPGVNPCDAAGMGRLTEELGGLSRPEVHLVLNAAYENKLLLDQARAFRRFNIHDVVLTHVDEDARWGKLWNFALGSNCAVSWLSAGQNVPGDLRDAHPETILPHGLGLN